MPAQSSTGAVSTLSAGTSQTTLNGQLMLEPFLVGRAKAAEAVGDWVAASAHWASAAEVAFGIAAALPPGAAKVGAERRGKDHARASAAAATRAKAQEKKSVVGTALATGGSSLIPDSAPPAGSTSGGMPTGAKVALGIGAGALVIGLVSYYL